MTPTPPAQQDFNRANFILLNNYQLFTAKQVADLIQQYTYPHTSTPNPCEEQGCTDIENCDEICEHSRIYSPAWVKQHDTAIRNATLDKVIEWVDNADNHTKDPGNGKHYVCLPDLIIFTESLRTQQEQP